MESSVIQLSTDHTSQIVIAVLEYVSEELDHHVLEREACRLSSWMIVREQMRDLERNRIDGILGVDLGQANGPTGFTLNGTACTAV